MPTEVASLLAPDVKEALMNSMMIVMAVFGVLAIITVLLQKSVTNSVGAISGDTETYMGKNKGSSRESKLKIATVVFIALLLVTSIVYFVIQGI